MQRSKAVQQHNRSQLQQSKMVQRCKAPVGRAPGPKQQRRAVRLGSMLETKPAVQYAAQAQGRFGRTGTHKQLGAL